MTHTDTEGDEYLAWLLHVPPKYIEDVRIYKYNCCPEVKPTIVWFNQFTHAEYDDFCNSLHEDDADILCQSLVLSFPYQPKHTYSDDDRPKGVRTGFIKPSKITLNEL